MLISPRSTAPLMPDVRDLLGDEADDAAEREWTGEMRDEDAEGAAAAPPRAPPRPLRSRTAGTSTPASNRDKVS